MAENSRPASPPPLDAVLFDTDGVITDTAAAHCEAWKTLFDAFLASRGQEHSPFTESDYLDHVDGRPRHDGVRGFLMSRGIDLPQGRDDDSPESDTVIGLGNRKNLMFLKWLDENRVRPFPGTAALVGALREAGIRTAAFSSSRNASAVLRSAGVSHLFDACVTGTEMAELDQPGKPHPAILFEAARRLGVAPDHAAVVEDALSGVRAGRAGGFAQVVGIDRAGDGAALREAGASIVVRDLSEVALGPDRRLVRQNP
jgi:trehalose 6-phosphate phosphatase